MDRIEKSITVGVPVRTAYNQWTQFEEFPRFMEGVKEVRQLDDKHVHWTAEIAGKEKEWDAEIDEQVPDRRISWHSVSGTRNTGTVDFRPLGSGETEVHVLMEYEPEGVLENIAGFFNTADARVKGDLERFKEYIESRGTETGAWRGEVHGEEVATEGETGSQQSLRSESAEQKGQVLKEAREELKVGKRQVARGGVRARSEVREEEVREPVQLREERAVVDRQDTDRVAEPGEDVFTERTVEIREAAEEPVVAKRTRVTGEVALGKEETVREETVNETLRRVDVTIEPLSAEEERYFRDQHAQRFSAAERYEDYAPAYQFGYALQKHQRGEWNDIEPDVRRRWEASSLGPWEKFKEAVRAGWESRRR